MNALALSIAKLSILPGGQIVSLAPPTQCHDCGCEIREGQCRIEVTEGEICQTCYQNVEWPEDGE